MSLPQADSGSLKDRQHFHIRKTPLKHLSINLNDHPSVHDSLPWGLQAAFIYGKLNKPYLYTTEPISVTKINFIFSMALFPLQWWGFVMPGKWLYGATSPQPDYLYGL